MGRRGFGAKEQIEIAARAKPRREKWQNKKLSRTARVISFLENLPITKGRLLGTKMRLLPSQREFIERVYGATEPIRLAILSEARGNGKTGLITGLALCHLLGPESEQRGECYSAAKDLNQAGIIFKEMQAIIFAVPELAARTNVRSHNKEIEVMGGDGIGSIYKSLSADGRGGHGLSPTFWAYDELAQARDRLLLDNLRTSLGKRNRSLGVVLSTQAADDAHPLSELIDDAVASPDSGIVLQLRSAPDDADPFDETTIRAANPALGIFLDEKTIFAEAKQAKRMPSQESAFRNLRLNQRVSPVARDQLLTPEQWAKGDAAIDPAIFTDGRQVFGGIDLSSRADLTALVWAAEDNNGDVHLLPRVWSPADTISERTHIDRAPYDAWARNGHIKAVPGTSIDYDWVAVQLGEDAARFNVVRLNYDRWRIEILRQALARFGVAMPLTECGQGYKDMSPCVEAFEHLAKAGRIRHGKHPLLHWCFANSVVTRDAANNRKLDKSKSYGRIDVAVAAVMAVGAMKASIQPNVEMAALVA